MTSVKDFIAQSEADINNGRVSGEKRKQLVNFKNYAIAEGIRSSLDDYTPYWQKFISMYGDYDDKGNQIVYKDKEKLVEVTTNKMPVWGWAAIGVGGLAIITLVVILAVKASKKAKA